MARQGGKFQERDIFVMKRTYGKLSEGDTVEIIQNLGKKKRRTYVKAKNADGVVEEFKVIYLGRRVKRIP